MNYNQFMQPEVEQLPINSRAKLDTGTHCNYNCSFCYYGDKLDVKTDVEVIIARADKLYQNGIKEVDLSGGESSIHRNWFQILGYCSVLFDKVSVLSNGSKFSSFDFIKQSKQAGLSEILFSLHGYDEASHDKIVGVKGAFKKILIAIEHAQYLNIKIRLNCTVTKENVDRLDEYAKLINNLNAKQINFLPLNYWDNAGKSEYISYEVLSKGIKKAIDLIDDKIQINVRYIPFCFMEGYEKYVVDTYQHIFDLNDWNIICYGAGVDEIEEDIFEVKKLPTVKEYYAKAKDNIVNSYYKGSECFTCKYFDICDGVEHAIKTKQKIYPVVGHKIKKVMKFRGDYERI